MCETESERKARLVTFSDPFTNSSNVAKLARISPNTARKALNALAEKDLLFVDTEMKRNKKYRNYDLMRILRD